MKVSIECDHRHHTVDWADTQGVTMTPAPSFSLCKHNVTLVYQMVVQEGKVKHAGKLFKTKGKK